MASLNAYVELVRKFLLTLIYLKLGLTLKVKGGQAVYKNNTHIQELESHDNAKLELKDPHLKFLLQNIVWAHEGYWIAHSYSTSSVEMHHRYNGFAQQKLCLQHFYDNISELFLVWEGMKFNFGIIEEDQ